MGKKQENIKRKNGNIIYTILTVLSLCVVFSLMVSFFYINAEEEAFENLHIQTKQIKDDITLQLISDRENLATMANFASKLYSDGEGYDLMFDSFKPIGLIANIGILNPDNTFVTKVTKVDLNGKISFEEEKKKGEYISGRIKDLTRDNYEIIRSAVPIKSDGETVGILYGVIKLDVLAQKYNKMAKDLDAQLFVYSNDTGDLMIDTIQDELGNISFLKNREYNKGYSYEKMMESDKGFTSFISAYTNEDLYMHYSTLEDFDWTINLARYESQVFAKTHNILVILFITFVMMVIIMALYLLNIMKREKRRNSVMECASDVRQTLLEITQNHNSIFMALERVCHFTQSRSCLFFDSYGEEYNYSVPQREKDAVKPEYRKEFRARLFKYITNNFKNETTVIVSDICVNDNLKKKDSEYYDFLKSHNVRNLTFSVVSDKENYVTILCVINPKKQRVVKSLIGKVAVCFSIALFNKMHLNKTELAVVTDSLTGAYNRVGYKNDILLFDVEAPTDFSCIYIDVNELHRINNTYGHAAGDEMLVYISNTLKEVFYGHRVYRMGGDEFLIFVQGVSPDDIKDSINRLYEQLAVKNYHVAVGMAYRSQNNNTEEMTREAELRMYEAKARYYQEKEHKNALEKNDGDYLQINTGIAEIDAMLSVMKEHYNGIYRVSLDTDKAKRILMPSYLGYNENEKDFSKLLNKYINDTVDGEYHRAIITFLNYDAIKKQIYEGKVPQITYKKVDGEMVKLSVHKLGDDSSKINETLWIFSKKHI